MRQLRRDSLWCALCVGLLAIGGLAAVPRGLAADPKPAKKAEKAGAKAKSPVQGYYAIIAKQVGIEGDQLATFTAAVAARAAAIDAWEAANKAKLDELKQAAAEAKKNKDEAAAKKVQADAKGLNAARKKIEDDQRAKILAVLTPAQKVKLNGYNLYVGAMIKYKKLGLSEDQVTKTRGLCDKAAQDAGAEYGSDNKKDAAVKKALGETIEKDVLTAEQRTALAAPKKKPDAKGKKPAADK